MIKIKKRTDEDIMNCVLEKYPKSSILDIYRVGNKKRIKVKFKCGVCETFCDSYLDNITKNRGCKKCGNNKLKIKEEKIEEYNKILEDNGYLWINKKEYKENTKVGFLTKCMLCGYESKISNIQVRTLRGCKKCMGLEKKNIKYFEKEIENLGEKDNYIILSNEYIDNKTPIKMLHKECNNEYYVSRSNFLKGERCPHCQQSKGEKRIESFFQENNILFIKQYKIKDCKNIKSLPFDFYLPQYNILIEFDGKQHYKIVDFFDGLIGLMNRMYKDNIKTQYCKNNNIQLIRIPYWEFNDIERILEGVLNNG